MGLICTTPPPPKKFPIPLVLCEMVKATEFSEPPSHALLDSIAAVRALLGRAEQVGC